MRALFENNYVDSNQTVYGGYSVDRNKESGSCVFGLISGSVDLETICASNEAKTSPLIPNFPSCVPNSVATTAPLVQQTKGDTAGISGGSQVSASFIVLLAVIIGVYH
jgi:hypothetical protein